MERAACDSHERNSNGSFGGRLGAAEEWSVPVPVPIRPENESARPYRIVMSDRKLRSDLQFNAFVPNPTDSFGKRELQVSIATEAKAPDRQGR